jgi:CRISPR/Cas system-associated exonuclease Cas4 (RecB family)
MMEFPYRPELIDETGRYFDEVVARIQSKDFRVAAPPERKICKECDLKAYCSVEGLIADPDAPDVALRRMTAGARP